MSAYKTRMNRLTSRQGPATRNRSQGSPDSSRSRAGLPVTRYIGFFSYPIFLDNKHQNGNGEKHGRKGRSAFHVVIAHGLHVNLGSQGRVVAADDHRIAEVGDALDEDQQKSVGNTRPDQRQYDGPEDMAAGCAHVAGRFFIGRVDLP